MTLFSCCYILMVNIIIWLALPYLAHAQPRITVPPVPVTVPPLGTATFICEGNGTTLSWLVQIGTKTKELDRNPVLQQQRGISLTDPGPPGNLSPSVLTSVLTVDALPINDGIGIACQIASYQPFEQDLSGFSTLTIRGVSPVEDLQYNFLTNNSLLMTWLPPVYYSNDVPAGSPFCYQVLVTDEDGEMLLDTNTPDTNITVYNVTECDTFNITVTALVGEYNASNNTDYAGLGYNATITTSEDNFLMPKVFIELSCPPSKSNTFLTITSGTKVIDQYPITGSDEVVSFIRALITSNEYNYTVLVFNLRNKLEYENSTIISTYQVIDVYINNSYNNGSVNVQCIYEESSTADGCHVIFTHTVTGKNESFNITGQDIVTLPLPSGNYTVTVYDITGGSLYGPALYYPTLVEVIKVIASTATSSSILSESITPPPQSTISITVSPTVTETPGVGTTSSTSEPIVDANHIIPIVAGILSGVVLVILAVCVGITVYKKKRMYVKVLVKVLSPPDVELIYVGQIIDEENPYHLPDQLMPLEA